MGRCNPIEVAALNRVVKAPACPITMLAGWALTKAGANDDATPTGQTITVRTKQAPMTGKNPRACLLAISSNLGEDPGAYTDSGRQRPGRIYGP